MKFTPFLLGTTALGLTLAPGIAVAQQSLKTDPAGNPTTALNLGGVNVTGILAAARLPAGVSTPVVQIISQTQGNVALAAGTNVAVLSAPLTGVLNLRLPASNAATAGRALIVVDPANYSSANQPVTVLPTGSDLCNGQAAGASATPVLTGTGAEVFYPDGAGRWSTGQSYLRAPSSAGLTLASPATDGNGMVLSVRNGTDAEFFAVVGDGSVNAYNFNANNVFTSDADSIYTDGEGTFAANLILANGSVSSYFYDFGAIDPGTISAPANGARLYVGADGKLHVRTPDNADHVLSWTPAP